MGFEIGFTEYWAAGALTESGGGGGGEIRLQVFQVCGVFCV